MSIQRYTMRVECMAYCYGGTARLEEVDGRWEPDPDELVTYADHVAALLTQDRQHMEQQAAAVTAAEQRIRGERLVHVIFHSPNDGPRAFALVRTTDVSGVSGTGTVAYGVEFPDGTVALRWVGGNPTSVVFHDNGMESVEAIHGHSGATQIMWLSEDLGPRAAEMDECESRGYAKGVDSARDAVAAVWSAPDGLLRGLCNHADALAAIDALRGEA